VMDDDGILKLLLLLLQSFVVLELLLRARR
jgi:hypothetical protein